YDSIRGAYGFGGQSPYPAFGAIKEQVPEVEQIAMAATSARRRVFEINGNRFREPNALVVDDNWLDMFGYKIIEGSMDDFIAHPLSVILTQSKATKYFGNAVALQQTLHIDSVAYTVVAVIEDIPPYASFQQDVLISNVGFNEKDKSLLETWGYYSQLLYVKLSPGASVEQAENKISRIFSDNQPWMENSPSSRLVLLSDLHVEKDLLEHIISHGNTRNVWVFTILTTLLLAVASVNFVNLSLARIGFRIKEIGIRKTIGASKYQLFNQVMVETSLSVISAAIIALLLVILLLPTFNAFVEQSLVLNLLDPPIASIILGTVLLVLLMTGLYPALALPTLGPIRLLKNETLAGISRQRFRKILVGGQLAFMMVMCVGVATIYRQFIFIQQQTEGYQKDQVFRLNFSFPVEFESNDEVAVEHHSTRVSSVKTHLLANNSIRSVSQVNGVGLLGMVTVSVLQRTKEIGIRKVMGASGAVIVGLLSKDYIKLVLVAVLIASPIAWYGMNRWLADFAYRIDIEWWMFALAGIMAVGLALVTVSFQAIRAAVANPVESLRSE